MPTFALIKISLSFLLLWVKVHKYCQFNSPVPNIGLVHPSPRCLKGSSRKSTCSYRCLWSTQWRITLVVSSDPSPVGSETQAEDSPNCLFVTNYGLDTLQRSTTHPVKSHPCSDPSPAGLLAQAVGPLDYSFTRKYKVDILQMFFTGQCWVTRVVTHWLTHSRHRSTDPILHTQ